MNNSTPSLPSAGLLKKNLEVLDKRWPDIYQAINRTTKRPSIAVSRDTPVPTLIIDGIHLSSGYDRVKEAQLQSLLVPDKSNKAWVYGVGLGDLPRTLLERNKIEQLFVVIMNLGLVRQSFSSLDHTDWLSDPRVNLLTATDQIDVHFPFATTPPCLELADNSSASLRDLIYLELATPSICKKHSPDNRHLIERLAENKNFMQMDGDVTSLFGSAIGETIIIAAAGPTLAKHYEWIRQQQEKHLLIAVDAALRPLHKAGINPDIVVTIDGHPKLIYTFFNDLDLTPYEQRPLIYFPIVHKNVLNLWPGPRFVAYADLPLYREYINKFPKGILFASGGVLHPATDLAIKMGATKVVLLGADYAFPNNQTHVKNCSVAQKREAGLNFWVLSGRGERIQTAPNYRGALRDLERYIAYHPEVTFINGSREGALIKNTTFLEK